MEASKMDVQQPINPVARQGSSLPAARSSQEVRLNDITDLSPVDRDEFYAEVAPCLTLAAGVGMSQPDQDAWLEAAFIALEGIPIGLLRRGARVALRTADHPSKIVPAIMAEIGEAWKWRKGRPRQLAELPAPTRKSVLDRRGEPMSQADTDELNDRLEKLGATARYRPDGTRYQVEPA